MHLCQGHLVAIEPLCGSIYIYIATLYAPATLWQYIYIYTHIYIYIYEIRMPDSSHFVAFRNMCIYIYIHICIHAAYDCTHANPSKHVHVYKHLLYHTCSCTHVLNLWVYDCLPVTQVFGPNMSLSMSRSAGRSGGPLLTAGRTGIATTRIPGFQDSGL